MKKLIVLIILFIACRAEAIQIHNGLHSFGGWTAPAADCDDWATANYALIYDAESEEGGEYGWKASCADLQGTMGGNAATLTSIGVDGSNALVLYGTDDYLTFPVTGGDVFDSTQGYVSMWVWLSATTGENAFFQSPSAGSPGTNYLQIVAKVSNDLDIRFSSTAGSLVSLATIATITDTILTNIQFKWDDGNSFSGGTDLAVKVGDWGWEYEADADSVEAWASEPSVIYLGENSLTITDDIYIDQFQIWTTPDQS